MIEFILHFTDSINAWILLIFGIFCSAMGTTSLKFLSHTKRLLFIIPVILGYALFLFLITVVLKRIPMTVGYATWAGLSTALMSVSGVIFFEEHLSIKKVISLILIILGVVGLNLFLKSV